MTVPADKLALPCPPEAIDAFLSQPQPGALETLGRHEGDILVLGAGGKMGLHLCLLLQRALLELGKSGQVWAASRFRSLHSREAYERAGLRVLAGDFRDEAFVDELPDCPLVFYLVGAKFGTTENPELLREINVEVAARLGLRFHKSRIVALSTGCVYSFVTPESGGSKEDSNTLPVGDYAISCLEREKRFAEVSRTYGTSIALVRLNYSVEFRYGVLVDIAQSVARDEPVDVSTGHFNVIWQNDALNQIVQCLDIAAPPCVPINITGQEIATVREVAGRFGQLLGRTPRFAGEEAPTAWLSDASRARERFGPPSVSLDTMIEWIAAWTARKGEIYGKPTGFQKRDGRF